MVLIPRRMLKASAGNWGKPNEVEKKVKLNKELLPEEPITKKAIRKKKQPYVSPGKLCPFCNTELPIDIKKIEEDKKCGKFVADWMSEYRIKECSNCGAYEVTKHCPACHRNTWYDPKTKIYKHQWLGCGFIGELKSN